MRKKKYAEILLHYRQLFIKGNIIIGEWKYLVWKFSFIIADFSLNATLFIGGVECMLQCNGNVTGHNIIPYFNTKYAVM